MAHIPNRYATITDYILDTVFHFPTCLPVGHGKLRSSLPLDPTTMQPLRTKAFQPNAFPYNLPDGSHHYLLWYSFDPPLVTEATVNADIHSGLASLLGHARFEFAWYENPKMTVPGVYHVQVFWHEVL
jgi:hypothetical protein